MVHGIVISMFREVRFLMLGAALGLFPSSTCVSVHAAAADPVVSSAVLPSVDALLDAKLTDLADKPVSLRGLTGKVVVVVHQDRHSSEQNLALNDKLSTLSARFPTELKIVALADVGGYDFWPAKGYVKDALKSLDSGGGALVLCDWKGAVRKAYQLRPKHSVVFVLSKGLELVSMTKGQLSAADTDRVAQRIEAELGK